MKNHRYKLVLLAVCLLFAASAFGQHTVVKTNALCWATTTPNLALETKIGRKWTAELSYAGHFFGMHLVYSHYNIGGIKLPLGIFKDLRNYRYQGDLGALGFGYGYSWMLPGNHWSIEAEVGVGVGITKYEKYECATCGSKVGSDTKTLFMPT